jgi:hypothetical protein
MFRIVNVTCGLSTVPTYKAFYNDEGECTNQQKITLLLSSEILEQ